MTDRVIQLPQKVQRIIHRLQTHGYEAYAVGGCVRDGLLGREPHDWDITTSALPEQVKQVFAHTIDTGIEHGTVTVRMDHESFEVTTYRVDGAYDDARHPNEVRFTPSLAEDQLRRDFTINSMAYNDEQGLMDPYGGYEDLHAGVIRCVGVPMDRFGEDALRIMRAVRFAAQLDFTIDEETREAARTLAPNLRRISAERVREELMKLITSPHPQRLREAWELGITAVVLPEFDAMMQQSQTGPHHDDTVGEHTLKAMQAIRPEPALRLTMLLHDCAKPQTAVKEASSSEAAIWAFPGHAEAGEILAGQIMRRLKFDRRTMDLVRVLIRHHSWDIEKDMSLLHEDREILIRRKASAIGKEIFPLLLEVKRADLLSQKEDEEQRRRLSVLDQTEQTFRQILERGDCLSLKELAVTGSDLIGLGAKPGRGIGQILERLLSEVLEDPSRNRRGTLLQEAAGLLHGD